MTWSIRFGLLSAMVGAYGQPAVLTFHNDNARTGEMLNETLLQPANVNTSSFGRLRTLSVDGLVDAQPLYVPNVSFAGVRHNLVIVVTEHDSAYAFDADTGSILWQVSLLGAQETTSDPRSCGQVSPEIGITSTPALDPAAGPHGAIYVVAMSKDTGGNYHQRLHALDLTTGTELFGGPVNIQATYPGVGDDSSGGVVTFDPKQYKERAALLLLNGVIYTSWASHCDIRPYTAWVIGYSQATLQRLSVLNLTPNGNEGAIWGAGNGPASDSSGNIFFLMGNGTFDTSLTNGFPSQGDYGNAFMKLSTDMGAPVAADYFTMLNTQSESGADTDLGSGGAILLPPLSDSQGSLRNLAVGAGKDTNIYVVDRDNMGKFNPSVDQIYQQLSGALPGGAWSSPAYFNGALYYGGVSDFLKAFTFTNGQFSTPPGSKSANSFGYPGATPAISANGASNGIVWAAENTNPAVLHAYDAGNLGTELYRSSQNSARDSFGAGNKYIVPTVANGKVFVGTTNGVGVFGLLNCSYSINPTSATIPSGGANASASLTASSGCLWGINNPSSFVSVNGGVSSGSGNAVISYSVPATSGAPRAATLTIGGQTLKILQQGMQSKIGIFRSGQWWMDVNGDFQWTVAADRLTYLGQNGDIPVVGDWDGTGVLRIGVFRNGQWWLDMDGDGAWDSTNDLVFSFGQAGDIPVVGDWDNTGRQRIGVFRSGQWWLDMNGDHKWDAAHDLLFNYGQAGDIPVVGDWDNTGSQRIGVFRGGQWWLDMNGDHAWDTLHDLLFNYGQPGDIPVVADWTNSGQERIGVFRNGQWWLDLNGDHQWQTGVDLEFFFGEPGDLPVTGVWTP
jgi:hypothetical protein